MKSIIDTDELDKLIEKQYQIIDSSPNAKHTVVNKLRALQQVKSLCTPATPIVEALKKAENYIWDVGILKKIDAALSLLESKNL